LANSCIFVLNKSPIFIATTDVVPTVRCCFGMFNILDKCANTFYDLVIVASSRNFFRNSNEEVWFSIIRTCSCSCSLDPRKEG
jgi:hypothetical protein